jgi:Uri superfamily endonuclease
MISGIIYAIIDDGYFYIGSTTRSLEERLYNHIIDSKSESKKYSKLYKYINEVRGGWVDIIYIPLETIECKTEYELKKKEYSYIQPHIGDKFCLNTVSNIKSEYMIMKRKKKSA